ncbi:MAG: DUF6675 family protein [Bryobacteraceae bacterium]
MFRRAAMALFITVLCCGNSIGAESGPQTPCGAEPVPPFPPLEVSPTARIWNSNDLPAGWKPPACTGWAASDFPTIVAVAARFRFAASVDGLRRRIGAISETKGMFYWSTTQKRWQKLILDAHASPGPDGNQSRPDFSLDEIAEGQTLFFQQEDNLFGKAAYRMHIRSVSAGRLVFDVENAATIRYLTIPLFEPGQVQSIYYLEEESAGLWRYYGIARTSGKAAELMVGHEASAINRAVAFYRHLVGIPTDREPPASR